MGWDLGFGMGFGMGFGIGMGLWQMGWDDGIWDGIWDGMGVGILPFPLIWVASIDTPYLILEWFKLLGNYFSSLC